MHGRHGRIPVPVGTSELQNLWEGSQMFGDRPQKVIVEIASISVIRLGSLSEQSVRQKGE